MPAGEGFGVGRLACAFGLMGLVIGLVLLSACARRDGAALAQQDDRDAQRRIYAGLSRPLVTADPDLLAALPGHDAQVAAFKLSASGATALGRPPEASDACHEDIVLFITSAAGGRWLLDPRSLRFVRLADASCTIHRSLLVSTTLGLHDGVLEVFRFDFTVAATITPTLVRRLTGDGGNVLPVALPPAGDLLYLHRVDGGRSVLMRMAADGSGQRAVHADQPFDIRHLQRVGDGVAFAANRDGVYRLYRATLDRPEPIAWDGVRPLGEVDDSRHSVGFAWDGSRLTPRLVEVPARLGHEQIAALVEARNPAVLRQRALLAAALIEAQQLELANLPVLSLGAFYTPAVGIFTDPVGFSGDYLAENTLRGLIGVTQPLLDWDRNRALSRAGALRATIARDALEEELNRQQAAAAIAAIAYQGHRARLASDRAMLALAEDALRILGQQRQAGRVGSDELAVAEHERLARQADVTSDERWMEVLAARLKALCGLAPNCPTEADEPLPWEDRPLGGYDEVQRLALLNHPRLSAAHASISEAFYRGQAGSRYRPTLATNAAYGHSTELDGNGVDDFLTLGLSGTLPVAWFQDRDLDRQYQDRLQEALRAGEDDAALTISRQLAEAWARHHQARGALQAERAQVQAVQGRLRTATLRAEHGLPGVDEPLTALGLIRYQRVVQLAERSAATHWQEAAEQFIRLAEAQGLAGGLWRAALPSSATVLGNPAPLAATWLWQRDLALGDDGVAVIAGAQAAGVDRIYVYVGADGLVLEQQGDALASFIARCAAARIAVWALMGEPEWFDGVEPHAAFTRLAVYQQRSSQPFAGLKLDLEPQARPEWSAGGAPQRVLAFRLLALLAAARSAVDLPLWFDCPLQFLRTDQEDLRQDLISSVDGVTVMCYHADPAVVLALAREALARWPTSLEIGVELGRGSPPTETMADLPPERIAALRRQIEALAATHPRLRGVALHDLGTLVSYATVSASSAAALKESP